MVCYVLRKIFLIFFQVGYKPVKSLHSPEAQVLLCRRYFFESLAGERCPCTLLTVMPVSPNMTPSSFVASIKVKGQAHAIICYISQILGLSELV